MAEEPEKPKHVNLNICEAHDVRCLSFYLGVLISYIRIRNEVFFVKPDELFFRRCDLIKEQFGIVCDTGFRNYIEAIEALTEFEKKWGLEQINVPGPLDYDTYPYEIFYDTFQEKISLHTTYDNEINRDILTLIVKAANSLR